ncbi:hypothetical protein TNCV_4316481 [Trichonephila clavipes]|nr:hypothetical protein TNCV_4316481 [Trichonephila clavipes]
MASTQELNPVKAWSVRSCLNSPSRTIAGRDGHQHLFFPSFGVWYARLSFSKGGHPKMSWWSAGRSQLTQCPSLP